MAVPHSLARLKTKYVNKPQLIEQNTFAGIMDYINARNGGEFSIPEMATDSGSDAGKGNYVDAAKLGILEISGPLTYRTSGWEALCGGTSYEMLKNQMEYFVSQGAKTVAMYVDSGGGEAHGMIDSSNYVRKLADENGIKIVAFVDGMSASAAYGWSAIADEIVMTSDSQVGSIGVLIQLMNNSGALEKAGYERTFITAGADKVPFDNDGKFTESFLEGLQEQVDTLYESFTSHVALHRGISQDAVKGTEANVFMSKDALTLGLADKVMTAEEFNEYIGDVAMSNFDVAPTPSRFKLSNITEETEMSQELVDALAKANAQLETQAEALASVTALQSQLADLTSKLEASQLAVKELEDAKAAAALAARKAALTEVLPTDQVEAKLTSFASLDQATFDFMVGELQAAKDARAASFKAIGEEGVQEEEGDKGEDANASYNALLSAGKAAAARLHS